MIILKTDRELDCMRKACRLSAEALQLVGRSVKAGITTYELDKIAERYILENGGKPNFKGIDGYPATACISINNEVIHGIPSHSVRLKAGDIVSVDLGAAVDGYNGDNAATFAVGEISDEAKRLIDITRQSLYDGIKAACVGGRIGDISSAVQKRVEQAGFSVVREFVGHGVGTALHEAPEVPNYGVAGKGTRLLEGMTIAIEPMVNVGGYEVEKLSDGWTVVTKDGSLSAHFEHTIAITSNGPEILTVVD